MPQRVVNWIFQAENYSGFLCDPHLPCSVVSRPGLQGSWKAGSTAATLSQYLMGLRWDRLLNRGLLDSMSLRNSSSDTGRVATSLCFPSLSSQILLWPGLRFSHRAGGNPSAFELAHFRPRTVLGFCLAGGPSHLDYREERIFEPQFQAVCYTSVCLWHQSPNRLTLEEVGFFLMFFKILRALLLSITCSDCYIRIRIFHWSHIIFVILHLKE